MIRTLRVKLILALFVTFIGATSIKGQVVITDQYPENGNKNISNNIVLELVFNTNVFAGDGLIQIFNDEEMVIEFAATDAAVHFNGKIVEIDLPFQLEKNTTYNILIDDNTFVSSSNEYFKGISSHSEWRFTTEAKTIFENQFPEAKPYFYPNPAQNVIHLVNIENVASLFVTNLVGRNIIELKSLEPQVMINNIPSGMYFVTFVLKDGSKHTKKLLKQ